MPWLWLIVGGLRSRVHDFAALRRRLPERALDARFPGVGGGQHGPARGRLASIPMGTAYAVWGGIGAVGTVVVGILWFHEPASTVRLLLILAIVAAIAALRMTG